MENVVQKFEESYLLGCIHYKGQYELYLMPIAWWILNYEMYAPEDSIKQTVTYESGLRAYEPPPPFRDNILNVTDDKMEGFLNAIKEDKLSKEDLTLLDQVESDFRAFYFFIDLDSKLFISIFNDIDVESYLPDETWKGACDFPLNYIPQDLKAIIEPWQRYMFE